MPHGPRKFSATKMKNNLVQRTLTGGLLVALIIALILFNNLLFTALLFAIVLGCTHELHPLIRLSNRLLKNLSFAAASATFLLVALGGNYTHSPKIIIASFALIALVPFTLSLFIKEADAISQSFRVLVPMTYIALPLGLVPLFSEIIPSAGKQPMMILSLFILIWVNDTFAYLTGITFGRHRLFERISPKKSWEGAVGGFLFSLLAALILFKVTALMTLPAWLGLAVVVVIFGIFGDLFESLLKRTNMVKDSGNLLPGHGGLLDRFDALLFAAPAAWIFLSIMLS